MNKNINKEVIYVNETLEKIGELGIVPVVKIEKAEDALPLGRALIDGDLPIAEITRITREAISIMLGFEFAHLGINEETKDKALNSANLLSRLFYFPIKEGTSSVFAGPGFEVVKNKYLGKHGHIAIATNNIHRAITYLKMKDISLLPETAKEKDGKLKAIYLAQEVSGFALHLLQK